MMNIFDKKFILGLTAGIVIGAGLMGLKPLQAANSETSGVEQQLNLLLKEVKATNANSQTVTNELKKISKSVDQVATDTHKIAGRSDINPAKTPDY